jgi:hypothetical protein
MNKIKLLVGILMTLAAVQIARAEDLFKLTTVQGTVVGFEKEVLSIQPADSKVKAVTLHVTGTSRVSIAGTQSREGWTFMVQRDAEPKALAEKQKITAIYAVMGTERVLLSAVAHGDDKK